MCLRDLLERLRQDGLNVTEAKIRWAMKGGRIARPSLDGSLRFDFQEEHVRQLHAWFSRNESNRFSSE